MFKLFKKFDERDWFSVLFIIGFIVLQVWLDLTMPEFTSKLTSSIAQTGVQMSEVWYNGGMMLLCAFGSMLASFCCAFFCARLASKFAKTLRLDLYNKIAEFSRAEIKIFSTPSLITRTTNDVVQIQNFIAMGLQIIIKAPTLAIWAITKISATSVEWTMATLITVVIMMTLVIVIACLVLPKFKKIQKLIDNVNDVTRENVAGVRVVRAFNAEDYQEKKFEKANDELTKNQLFTSKATGLLMPVMSLCMNGLTLAIYWIGAILINNAQIVERATIIGNMTAFTQYALQVVMAFIMLVAIFILLPRCIVSAKRINEVLDAPISIQPGKKSNNSKTKGKVEFRNVSFKYNDGNNNVIEDVSFEVDNGETLAIIGATGCGKTTLINLIPRFADVSSGEVLVDGMNVKDYNEEELQGKIAVVSQKACLFKGDVKSNITYGSEEKVADDDPRIKQAIEVSQSLFVNELKDGVRSEVAQGGTNFSGGQKQRLSIARAVYKDAEIIIFDDSFSALDYKTDMTVRKKIKENLADKTVIIVAQRIGTIKHADKILVLDNGKIVGAGKHEELLENCPVYKEIALSQLSKEEL
ncbi:MAG: ABC transporter ATP-binding protein [Christensenellales bacterium]